MLQRGGHRGEEPRFASVRLTGEVLDEAARLCARHGLRALEAVQLATAMAARRGDPSCTVLATFEPQLRERAAAEGFALLPG